ncbi:unnamed protein product [Peniophora sp. CBMAI 1063]|nr:unnamed protein product [Peniophora sp. CBMAI 1063]
MEAVQHPHDGFPESRRWLSEYLCHSVLAVGSPDWLSRLILKQVFPLGASKRKGALRLTHICTPRVMTIWNPIDLPPFDPAQYRVVEVLADGGLHALVHITPVVPLSPITSVPRASRSSAVVERRHTLRSRKQGPVVEEKQRPGKKRKTVGERRFTVFIQVNVASSPCSTIDGAARLLELVVGDIESEYFFVFVTAKDEVLDPSTIPDFLLHRFKWYHLSIDSDM